MSNDYTKELNFAAFQAAHSPEKYLEFIMARSISHEGKDLTNTDMRFEITYNLIHSVEVFNTLFKREKIVLEGKEDFIKTYGSWSPPLITYKQKARIKNGELHALKRSPEIWIEGEPTFRSIRIERINKKISPWEEQIQSLPSVIGIKKRIFLCLNAMECNKECLLCEQKDHFKIVYDYETELASPYIQALRARVDEILTPLSKKIWEQIMERMPRPPKKDFIHPAIQKIMNDNPQIKRILNEWDQPGE